MRKIHFVFIVAILVLFSCKKEEESASYITVDDIKYSLNTGYSQNMTWQGDTKSTYKITLANNSNTTETNFTFRLITPHTTEISAGNYVYSWTLNDTYIFVSPKLETFDGKVYTEEYFTWTGSINVAENGEDLKFTINLVLTDDATNRSFSIKGDFHETLSEVN